MRPSRVSTDDLSRAVRNIPDFPKPGIIFKDITPLLSQPEALQVTIEAMADRVKSLGVDKVVAIESRGFLFGSALALHLKAGLTLVRKPKKLPYRTKRIEYDLEYGTDSLEMHVDALTQGDRVIIVDDVLATGGTAGATIRLVESMGAKVMALVFLAELSFLNGRNKLGAHGASGGRVHSLLSY